jgi:uncharacterized protein YkwD
MSALVLLPLVVLLATPSTFEARVFAEIVALRTSPRAYAAKLRSYRKRFEGKVVKVEGRPDLKTHEGVSAVDDAIEDLEKVRSLPSLELSPGLSRAARDHARDLSRTGRVSHQGSDGSRPDQRIDRHGRWDGTVGENLTFANVPADEVVILLLIDDGVRDRGHRRALLKPAFRAVGVACAPHRYGKVCVMDFAVRFKGK